MLSALALLPFAGAALPLLVEKRGRNAAAWAAAAVAGAALAIVLALAPEVFARRVVHGGVPWIPSIGLNASFRLDGLGLMFALLMLGIGLLVILYARYYLSEHDPIGRFYAYLLLFMGAMLGIVISENLLLLLIFWEGTSLSSFLLIGYWQHRSDARQGARMALAITGAGGLAMLAGFLLLGEIAGSFELSVVLASRDAVHASPLYLPALVLILLGAFTKSAQFPFHFWLPHAMAAPTPVSAYLHSATMVKAGVFLLARLYPALGESDAWFYLVGGTGLATLVFAAWVAVFKHDLKGLLAYSTISHLGLITFLLGLDSPLSSVAAVFHIINHATFKASLFMAAGIIDHETGSRDMRRLNGLWKYMPHTGTLAMVAASAMAGVPLLNGFLSKEMFFAEALELHQLGWFGILAPVAAVAAATFSVAYSLRFIHDVFFHGEPVNLPRKPHEPPRYMMVPVECLVLVCVLVGTLPGLTVQPLLNLAAGAVLGGPPPRYDVAIWHGINPPLLMSIGALAAGAALYFSLQGIYRLHRHVPSGPTGKGVYDTLLRGFRAGCTGFTRRLHNGSLQHYLMLTAAAAVAAGAAPLLGSGFARGPLPAAGPDVVSLTVWFALVSSALTAAALHRHRLLALLLVGVAGLGVALVFLKFSAPDLALTQLVVELASVLLLLLALYLLPPRTPRETPAPRRAGHLALAALAGGGAGALAWAVLTRPLDSLSGYYLENSVPGGGGSNVVNVILVDFRGFDTFGEITVLAVAAFGIAAMLAGWRVPRPAADADGRAWAGDAHPLMLSMVTRLLLPLALLVSIYIFLRGHNAPGGGFIAGLVTGVALVMQYMASGIRWAEQRIRIGFAPLAAGGVLIAGLAGAASWAFGRPFLTSAFGHFHLPLIGEVELASAMVFDLGVYLTVVGATLLILSSLGGVSSAPDDAGERG